MLNRFKSNPNLKLFLLYSASFFAFGMELCALGPMIPYLSQKMNIQQTDFNLYFGYRSIGGIIGVICIKFESRFLNLHNCIWLGGLLSGILFGFSSVVDSFYLSAVYIFLAQIFLATLEINLILCILQSHKNNQQDFWLQMGYGAVGIGGLFIPLIIRYFTQKGVWIITIIFIILIPFYFLFESPEQTNKEKQQQRKLQQKQKDKQSHINSEVQLIQITMKQQLLLGLMLFFYFGEEVSFSGWISSYTILMDAQTKEQATIFTTIIWAVITIMRFILPMVLTGPPHKKLFYLIMFSIFGICGAIILQKLNLILSSAYFSTIIYGIALSGMHPYILTIPIYFGRNFSTQVSGNIMMVGVVGEGIIGTLVGYLMDIFGPTAFYPSFLLAAIIKILFLYILVKGWIQPDSNVEGKQDRNSIEMNLLPK